LVVRLLVTPIGSLAGTLDTNSMVVLVAIFVDLRAASTDAKYIFQHLDSSLSIEESSVDMIDLEVLHFSLRLY
jgi:hypothetical protein